MGCKIGEGKAKLAYYCQLWRKVDPLEVTRCMLDNILGLFKAATVWLGRRAVVLRVLCREPRMNG